MNSRKLFFKESTEVLMTWFRPFLGVFYLLQGSFLLCYKCSLSFAAVRPLGGYWMHCVAVRLRVKYSVLTYWQAVGMTEFWNAGIERTQRRNCKSMHRRNFSLLFLG